MRYALKKLKETLAKVPDYGPSDGSTAEQRKILQMAVSVGAVLDFLKAVEIPLASRISLLEVLKLIDQDPRQRGGQTKKAYLECCAIQRLIDAGLSEEAAIKGVSDRRIKRENIGDSKASLKQVKKWWANRTDTGWKNAMEQNRPSMTVEELQALNFEIAKLMTK